VPDAFRALVRRRRDGRVAFDLDLVHAGVVAEALEQTRAVLTDDLPEVLPDDLTDAAAGSSGSPGSAGRTGSAGEPPARDPDDEFDAIVSRLGGVGGPDERVLGGEGSEEAEALRDDPVVRRLLPDAFLDDPEASAEFRRLSADTVRGRKVGAIDTVLEDLDAMRRQEGAVVVDAERAAAWLTALNDARLALGTLLAVSEDDDLQAELDAYEQQMVAEQLSGTSREPDEASTERALRAYRIAVYDFLSALLDMVVRALDR
jgi:hypothetical protein